VKSHAKSKKNIFFVTADGSFVDNKKNYNVTKYNPALHSIVLTNNWLKNATAD
jgi:hypothetical protein